MRVWCSYQGNAEVSELKKGVWHTKMASDVQVVSSTNDKGYDLKIIIPKKYIKSGSGKDLRLALGLSAYSDAVNGYKEMLANSEENKLNTWLRVSLLN